MKDPLLMRTRFSTVARNFLAIALAASAVACTTAPATSDPRADLWARIVAAPDRTAADRTNDLRRKPEMMLAFIDARPGSTALDVSTGGGYTTELLARAIGPSGTVFAQSPPRVAGGTPPAAPAVPEGNSAPMPGAASAPAMPAPPPRAPRSTGDVLAERSARMLQAGVAAAPIVYVAAPFDDPVPPAYANGKLDLVTLMFNYHDFGYMGVDRARMNRKIFDALKPGGFYVIADHAGRPGTGIGEAGTLHRIEEAFLRQEVESAGFRVAEEGYFLHNPNDPRNKNTPEPPQPKDEFVLKFFKPN
jgi:predicted methyltransferase